MKTCSKCGIIKELSEFNKDKQGKHGVRGNCRICQNKHNRHYYKENEDELRRKKIKYYEENIEEMRERDIKRYKKDKEKRLKQAKKYYENNRETRINYNRKYYSDNKRQIIMQHFKYGQTEKGHMVKINATHKRRNIKIQTSDGTIPINICFPLSDEIANILSAQNNKCNICCCNIKRGNMHLDHIIPLSKGGTHSLDNIQWLCATCNLKKGDKIIS